MAEPRILVKQAVHWLDSAEVLRKQCRAWRACKMLAVDTEFMRSQTYYPIAGLFQVNDGEANYLIDPTTINDLSAFADVLQDENIVKILHSCSEDLEVFQQSLDIVPQNLFDTQIAAALCGFGFSLGFGRLVKAAIDIELPKEQTRSDWLHRPLSQAQIDYAAIDVEYLFQLAKILILKLKNAGRLAWLNEDCERLLSNYLESYDETKSYLRIKQAWRFSDRKLAVLQALAAWRERKARQRDVPRNRVVKEHTLTELAMMLPREIGELRKFEGLTERMIRSDGAELIALIRDALKTETNDFPPALPKPLTSSENRWAKKLRASVTSLAEQSQVATELLLKKRDYESITRYFLARDKSDEAGVRESLKQFIDGWRYEFLSECLSSTICQAEG